MPFNRKEDTKENSLQGIKSKAFTSDYLMGSAHKSHANAKPVTTSDKTMSDEHKQRRTEIDEISDHLTRMKESIKYNKLHRDEHDKALKKTKSLLHAHIAGKIATKFLNSKGY